jgi:hypothetical protein
MLRIIDVAVVQLSDSSCKQLAPTSAKIDVLFYFFHKGFIFCLIVAYCI